MTGSDPFGYVLVDGAGETAKRRGRTVLYRTQQDAKKALTLKTTVAGIPVGVLTPQPVYLKPPEA